MKTNNDKDKDQKKDNTDMILRTTVTAIFLIGGAVVIIKLVKVILRDLEDMGL